eukprot:3056602-Pyramimonas_sp.AAC.1
MPLCVRRPRDSESAASDWSAVRIPAFPVSDWPEETAKRVRFPLLQRVAIRARSLADPLLSAQCYNCAR